MTPIPFPKPLPRATPPVTLLVEGHLAILRRLLLRAGAKHGVLTPHEVALGLESVGALEGMLEERHAEQLRQGANHD
jgi:hypothetical protein